MKGRARGGQFHRIYRKPSFAADRRGFSLLEILIAMSILALVAAPICRAFVSATRTNADARMHASATSVAENIMEGVNAFSYEDAVEQFESKEADPTFEFLICQGVERCEKSDEENGRVIFKLKNVKEDVYSFDVLVTLDRTPYMQADGGGTPGENGQELVSVTGYKAEKDYLFAENEDALSTACVNHGYDYDTVKDSLKREIIIKVNKSDSDGDGTDDCVTVSTLIRYTVGGDTWEDTGFGAREYRTADLLRSCYLCYLPNYAAHGGSPDRDTIILENRDNVGFDLYLIKQKSTAVPNLESKETLYTPIVRVYEGSKEPADPHVSVHTNYAKNLARDDAPVGAVTYDYYYPLGGSDQKLLDDNEVKDILSLTDSVTGTSYNGRIFRVEVKVFEEGAYDANFTGEDIRQAAELSNG